MQTRGEKEPDLGQDRGGTAIDPAFHHSQAIGTPGSDGTYWPSSLEQGTDFHWDSIDYMAWDQIFENFSTIPMP